jgi:ABC-2 type transport system ATP-binding protein
VRRPTLDDVFISLTGHAAETEPEEEAEQREEEAAA